MRRLYTLLLYCALPFILLRLCWRARKNPAYLQRWRERLGYLTKPINKHGLWIHAVSVGETLAAVPLIKALRLRYPELAITVTTTTPTGADRVQAALAEHVTHVYMPYDLPAVLQRFLDTIQPRCLMIMETELWPNLFQICAARHLPIMIANARLSAKSAAGYQRIAFLTRPMLKHITVLAAQTAADAERFIALGLDPTHVHITGSVKFDLEIPAELEQQAKLLRQQWGLDRLCWIAASTHEGEEELVLAAHTEIRKKLPTALLILVPRHPERFTRVATLCKRQGYPVILRSDNVPCSADTAVFIGDSMGELLLLYAASDVAFVGGSLIATGGHNPLEPAALGLPVIMGPYVFNFALISEELVASGAMRQINDSAQLASQISILLQDTQQRHAMGNYGQQFVAQNRGAVGKHLLLLEPFLH